jgi:F0F1-type ATP synthase membrane subunit b/b'
VDAWGLGLILASILAGTSAFIWLSIRIGRLGGTKKAVSLTDQATEQAEQDVEHIFNDEFRQELRNRGRLHFEKIIGENAMFLQQDLRLTTSQLNEYMKSEITRKLQEEFKKYEESITDAKQLAVDSINKTKVAIDEQRQLMSDQLQEEFVKEKARLIKQFEENMADIVNHYVLQAVGDQIDLTDQLEYILSDLEANKAAIIKDIQDGA